MLALDGVYVENGYGGLRFHRSQVSMSILNTRLSRCIQVIDWWRSAGVLSNSELQTRRALELLGYPAGQ